MASWTKAPFVTNARQRLVGTTMCECLSELCRQEQKKEISVLSNSRETFSQFRLDYYPTPLTPNTAPAPAPLWNGR